MNTAAELAIGCLAITVGWGICRAIQTRREERGTSGARDWGLEMQTAAELHLGGCEDAMWLEESGLDIETPAVAPYCGCRTCTVREVLAAAWPVMQDMILDVSHRSDIEFTLTTKRHPDE